MSTALTVLLAVYGGGGAAVAAFFTILWSRERPQPFGWRQVLIATVAVIAWPLLVTVFTATAIGDALVERWARRGGA